MYVAVKTGKIPVKFLDNIYFYPLSYLDENVDIYLRVISTKEKNVLNNSIHFVYGIIYIV